MRSKRAFEKNKWRAEVEYIACRVLIDAQSCDFETIMTMPADEILKNAALFTVRVAIDLDWLAPFREDRSRSDHDDSSATTLKLNLLPDDAERRSMNTLYRNERELIADHVLWYRRDLADAIVTFRKQWHKIEPVGAVVSLPAGHTLQTPAMIASRQAICENSLRERLLEFQRRTLVLLLGLYPENA